LLNAYKIDASHSPVVYKYEIRFVGSKLSTRDLGTIKEIDLAKHPKNDVQSIARKDALWDLYQALLQSNQEFFQIDDFKRDFKSYIYDCGINFYSTKRMCKMSGHLDNAEEEMDKPIISISFGNSAVFLLGGETKSTKPIPILINSGDIIIMGGRSRKCYHGIACVIKDSLPNYLKFDKVDKKYESYSNYLLSTRINFNSRQVYKKIQ